MPRYKYGDVRTKQEMQNKGLITMAKKTMRGGWLKCTIFKNNLSCDLEKSDGHIIPNKGGSFTAKRLYIEQVTTRTTVTLDTERLSLIPGLDKIVECDVTKNSAWCSVLQ